MMAMTKIASAKLSHVHIVRSHFERDPTYGNIARRKPIKRLLCRMKVIVLSLLLFLPSICYFYIYKYRRFAIVFIQFNSIEKQNSIQIQYKMFTFSFVPKCRTWLEVSSAAKRIHRWLVHIMWKFYGKCVMSLWKSMRWSARQWRTARVARSLWIS